MLPIPGKQVVDREAWLKERMSGIGSSEAAACLGIAPSPLEVYTRKVGIPAPDNDTIPKRVGRALEGTIAELYKEETGVEILQTQTLVRSGDHPFMLATLDGIAGGGRVVEFKTITVRRAGEVGTAEDEQVPQEWICQVHHQMICADVDTVDIAVLIGNEAFRVIPIHRDEMLCRLLIEAEESVWASVQRREPPAPRDGDDYRTVLRAYDRYEGAIQMPPDLERLAMQASNFGRISSAAKKAEDVLRKEIAHRLGHATAAVSPGGWTVSRKLISRKGYTVEPMSYPQLTIKAPKGYTDEQDPVLEHLALAAAATEIRNAPRGLEGQDRPDPAGVLQG